MSLIEFLKSGGPVMYPLIFASLLSLTIIIQKLLSLREKKIINKGEIETITTLIESGVLNKAEDICSRNPGIFNNIISAALQNRHLKREEIKEAISDAARNEVPKVEKYLGILGTIAGVSPLLGLLGTVTGMIKVFRIISVTGVGQAGALSGGIAEALITTATGLTIAIPTLVMYNYFTDKAGNIIRAIEKHSLHLMNIILEKQHEEKSMQANKVLETK
jgi:biopolymer transport protein ExbB